MPRPGRLFFIKFSSLSLKVLDFFLFGCSNSVNNPKLCRLVLENNKNFSGVQCPACMQIISQLQNFSPGSNVLSYVVHLAFFKRCLLSFQFCIRAHLLIVFPRYFRQCLRVYQQGTEQEDFRDMEHNQTT